jgi:hypothetical protein
MFASVDDTQKFAGGLLQTTPAHKLVHVPFWQTPPLHAVPFVTNTVPQTPAVHVAC